MGKLIYCSTGIAKNPYLFRQTKTNVYSIEEVCYYIRNHIYMLQEEIFDREFVLWLRNELHMENVADKMEKLIAKSGSIKDIVVTICCSCDYYEEDEIRELIRIMEDMEHLPKYARRKYKGDNYLQCRSYEKALEEYDKIFESDEILQAEPEIYGDIFHNMAVAYANIGEFHKASDLFLKAYEKNNKKESLSQCLSALSLCKETQQIQKLLHDLEIDEEWKEEWEKEYARAIEIGKSSKDSRRIGKMHQLLKRGAVEEYYDKVYQYILEWKEEYRSQISV